MKLSVELYTEQSLFIRDNSYIELSIRSHGFIIEESKGRDYYEKGTLLISNKRIAGIGRTNTYSLAKNFIGAEIFQARPGAYLDLSEDQSDDVALIIQTDIILDPGLVKHQMGIRIINEKGKNFDIPLARPDIEIYWDGRGRYVIPITEFVRSKVISSSIA